MLAKAGIRMVIDGLNCEFKLGLVAAFFIDKVLCFHLVLVVIFFMGFKLELKMGFQL